MSVQAVAKGVRQSPRKIGVVAALVRGRTVADALVILEHTPRRAAKPLVDVIKSAAANAEHNHNLNPKTLRIVSINLGPGPRYKRYMPISHGRAHEYQHRTTHIRVMVDGEQRVARKVAKPETKETKE